MVDPNIYQKYVTAEKNGNFFLDVKVLKELYELFKSVILFLKEIVKYMEGYGSNTNP